LSNFNIEMKFINRGTD